MIISIPKLKSGRINGLDRYGRTFEVGPKLTVKLKTSEEEAKFKPIGEVYREIGPDDSRVLRRLLRTKGFNKHAEARVLETPTTKERCVAYLIANDAA